MNDQDKIKEVKEANKEIKSASHEERIAEIKRRIAQLEEEKRKETERAEKLIKESEAEIPEEEIPKTEISQTAYMPEMKTDGENASAEEEKENTQNHKPPHTTHRIIPHQYHTLEKTQEKTQTPERVSKQELSIEKQESESKEKIDDGEKKFKKHKARSNTGSSTSHAEKAKHETRREPKQERQEKKYRHEIIDKSDNRVSPAWQYATGIMAILLLISISANMGIYSPKPQKVGDKVTNYINTDLLTTGTTATLSGIEETNGVYKLRLLVDNKQFDSYATKDGKLLFPSAIEVGTQIQANNAGNAAQPSQKVPSNIANNANTDTNQADKIQVSLDDDPATGPADAPITIVEFSDYQCPFCARAEPTIKDILRTYPDKVRFVYRDFPLSFHQYAQKAAEASECADEQGKFWEYHDKLFEKQGEWSSQGIPKLKEYAQQLGMDTTKFNQCLDSGKYYQEVQNDFEDGQKYGVSGTPAFFVNGREVSGAQPFSIFKSIIDGELAK